MKIIEYDYDYVVSKKQRKNDNKEELKEEWNKIVYEVIHYDYDNKNKNYILDKYEKVYNKICKKMKELYNESEYKVIYNELRLDCYKSLYMIMEHK